MNNGNGQDQPQPDLMVDGFHKLDPHLISRKPPKITFLPGFESKEDAVKIEYLKNLASTMNHAAMLVSEERDQIMELIVIKEKQLVKMQENVDAANEMIQSEVTRMNAQRQQYAANVAQLSARIRELESGGND